MNLDGVPDFSNPMSVDLFLKNLEFNLLSIDEMGRLSGNEKIAQGI